MTLQDFFKKNPRVAIGFSGGTDSSYLLAFAHKIGVQIQPYFIKGDFQPDFELEDAKNLCKKLGIPLKIIYVDVLENEKVKVNDEKRCYHCKLFGFGRIKEEARKDGYDEIIDGTNASDDISDRPGYQALLELGVLSPLRLCGITKEEVRKQSVELGLESAKKPSYACLATRVLETPLTKESLQLAMLAEERVKNLGFSDFRVRVQYDKAIIEMNEKQYKFGLEKWEEIKANLSDLFMHIEWCDKPRKASV